MNIHIAIKNNNYIIYLSVLAIFFLIALNSLFNSIAVAIGANPIYSTFLMLPYDLFGDYFKVIFSFITTERFDTNIGNWEYLNNLLGNYITNNPYRQVQQDTNLTSNLHGMPVSTAFALLNLYIMQWISPFGLFMAIFILVLSLYYLVARLVTNSLIIQLLIFILLIINYPFLFMVFRGHFFSAFTTLTILLFLIFVIRNNIPLAAIFLAIACNFRPNAVIFLSLLPMLCLNNHRVNLSKFLIYFFITALIIFFTFLVFCEYFYPNYNFKNLISSISLYYSNYAKGNAGLAFGSSFAGAIKYMFGYMKGSQLVIILFVLLMILFNIVYFIRKKLSVSCFLFNICVFYVLATPVFADYYLGIFVAPILYVFLESKIPIKINDSIVVIASILVLAPKNYVFISEVSFQVLLNPFVLLISTLLILRFAGLNNFQLK